MTHPTDRPALKARVAVDVGGTFTDVVELVAETGQLRFEKVPTTPDEPTRGVMAGFSAITTPLADVETFTHGTTLGLNALLTRTGARTAVVSTRGFRDVYLLGRTDRRVNYDITYRKPTPLLERHDTFEVTERARYDGSLLTPLDRPDAERVATTVAERGYDSVAVAFLHSYANPANELAMREALERLAPGVAVTLSHELSREYREFERTSTAVLDAYIKPVVREYLRALDGELTSNGFRGRFMMTRSGGGAMTASTAREKPVGLILSGPAGGVIGAAALSSTIGEPDLITIDMGGTSLDASLVIDGEPVLHQGAEFEQMPINTPSLYIHTIGAGGGSIGWLDAAGALQVGPASAGARPGPASYGFGGTAATFTDAALAIGYLGSETPLGGTLRLDPAKAEAALTPLAAGVGLDVKALARGMVEISTTKIMGAVRAITVEVGRDPHDFALLAFGGGGGLVAVDVAAELGIPTVVVPPGQGTFSAFGMLFADVQHDDARTEVTALADLDPAEAESSWSQMEEEACGRLSAQGFDADHRVLARSLDVRYSGQEHSVTVALPDGGGAQGAVDVRPEVEARFGALHERQYGHTMSDPVEVTTLRLRASGVVGKPELPVLPRRESGGPAPDGTREVYLSADHPAVPYALYTREALLAGDRLAGPAVINEHTATTVMHSGDSLTVGPHGELVITISSNHHHDAGAVKSSAALSPVAPSQHTEVVR